MSNSTTLLDTISSTQAQKEITANALFNAASPATMFGNRVVGTAGLIWAFYGGFAFVNGVLTAIANGTLTLTASTTNYVELSLAGVVSFNTTGFTPGSQALYSIVTGASTITSWIDHRTMQDSRRGIATVNVAGSSDVTLTAAHLRTQVLHLTGVLTGNINLLLPAIAAGYLIQNDSTGAFTITVKVSGGTGVVVAQGAAQLCISDGTNTLAVAGPAGSYAAGIATWLATPSSANLLAAITDETGTGALVFADTPTLVTPVIGAATGTSLVVSARLEAGTTVRLKGFTVATLPAGTVGDTAYVTDALTPTYLAVAVGGGAITAPVFYDGTNWVTA